MGSPRFDVSLELGGRARKKGGLAATTTLASAEELGVDRDPVRAARMPVCSVVVLVNPERKLNYRMPVDNIMIPRGRQGFRDL
jgi:hypothetical protein